jgi:hypothetical protein
LKGDQVSGAHIEALQHIIYDRHVL